MFKPKRSSLLSSDERAVIGKPQYRAYGDTKEAAVKQMTEWFLGEFDLHGNQGSVLAKAIVPKAIAAKQAGIHPTAPNILLNPKDYLDSVVFEAKKIAEEMDARNELEAILESAADREEYEKHGL